MDKLREVLKGWSLFEVSWLLGANLLMIVVGIILRDPFIAVVSAVAGIISVVLCAKGKISTYIFATINSVLYAYICFQNGLFGGMMLHVFYYIPMNIVGFISWNKKKNSNGEVKARRLTSKGILVVVASLFLGTFIYNQILTMLGGTLSLLDAYIAVNTIIAVILMVSRYAEQWVLWLVGNIVNITMWSMLIGTAPQAVTMIIMWSAYFINSSYGLYNWIKLNKKELNIQVSKVF